MKENNRTKDPKLRNKFKSIAFTELDFQKREDGAEEILEVVKFKNFLKLMTDNKLQIQSSKNTKQNHNEVERSYRDERPPYLEREKDESHSSLYVKNHASKKRVE